MTLESISLARERVFDVVRQKERFLSTHDMVLKKCSSGYWRNDMKQLRYAPGVFLQKEINARFSKDSGILETLVKHLINGDRRISLFTACQLGRYFGTSERIWLDLQKQYDDSRKDSK